MRFKIIVSTLYIVTLAKTFGKKTDLASQDGGQVAKEKSCFHVMSLISERETWGSIFNQRGEKILNEKEKKAKIKTQSGGVKDTGSITLARKSTGSKVRQTCCARVTKGQGGF